ncbi:unnamed protein product [Ixodes persulcatus]
MALRRKAARLRAGVDRGSMTDSTQSSRMRRSMTLPYWAPASRMATRSLCSTPFSPSLWPVSCMARFVPQQHCTPHKILSNSENATAITAVPDR